jgi:peptidyl-prolyl cis-trans isomerase B (cyclophilin B)
MSMTKYVKMTTSAGELRIELDDAKAPISTANFLSYVNKGFYDGTIFHRVIKNFMVQGGGFESGMTQKPTDATIQNEAKNGLKNDKYTLAMARTSAPHSASSQFFINTTNNGFLNNDQAQDGWGYAVFGKVVQGQEVVDAIAAVKTGRKGPYDDVPLEDVKIVKAEEVQA